MVGSGMYGVWLAGLMKPQPIAITMTTMATLTTTIRPLTKADSWVPRMSRAESSARITTAGTFMIPEMSVPGMVSKGECVHWYPSSMPKKPRTRLKYSVQAMATVEAPTAYSSTRSQPMIQATNSPMVA